MIKRTHKGQALLLILVILAGIIVGSAVLFARSSHVRAAPTVQEVFWEVNSQKVTTAGIGAEVEAHVFVRATEEYVGSIMTKIRKDISFWPDVDTSVKTEPVNLRGGQEIDFDLIFVPDQASHEGFRSLRGYFVEVHFTVTDTSWVMEDSYPPRLVVT